MNNIMHLDVNTGNIFIDENIIAGSHIKLVEIKKIAAIIGANEHFYPISNLHSLSKTKCKFIELPFSFVLDFKDEMCFRVTLYWQDGAAEQLGYEASQEDLSNETKFLGATLASYFGRKSDSKRKGDYIWYFAWGSVSVSYETKSNTCATYIIYNI